MYCIYCAMQADEFYVLVQLYKVCVVLLLLIGHSRQQCCAD